LPTFKPQPRFFGFGAFFLYLKNEEIYDYYIISYI